MENRGGKHFLFFGLLIIIAFVFSLFNPHQLANDDSPNIITGEQTATSQPSSRPAPQPLQRVGPALPDCNCIIAGSQPFTKTFPYTCSHGKQGTMTCTIECKTGCDSKQVKIPSNLPSSFPSTTIKITADGHLVNTKCEFSCPG